MLDEVFGATNFVALITVQKTTSATSNALRRVADLSPLVCKDSGNLSIESFSSKSHWRGAAVNYDQRSAARWNTTATLTSGRRDRFSIFAARRESFAAKSTSQSA